MHTGISSKHFLIAVAILMVSFLSLVAIMAITSTQRSGPAPAIIMAFLQVLISDLLANREQLYKFFTAKWLQLSMNFTYYVLPKNSDLNSMVRNFLATGNVTNWMPLWSTALFITGALGLAIWQLERKSL